MVFVDFSCFEICMQTVVIKIGTNAMTKEDRTLDTELLEDLVKQFAQVREQANLVIVSSGAMGCGQTLINVDRYEDITRRQLYAVVGQVKLMSIYADLFGKHGLNVAQLLATKDDFTSRNHFLNTKNCMVSLLKEKIVPIVNENDFVAVEELMFTDNDELAGEICAMLCADKLIVLSNIDGIYDTKGDVIDAFSHDAEIPPHLISAEKSSFGKGGIQTKFKMAQKVSNSGADVYIANSREKDVVLKIMQGDKVGTHFLANGKVKA